MKTLLWSMFLFGMVQAVPEAPLPPTTGAPPPAKVQAQASRLGPPVAPIAIFCRRYQNVPAMVVQSDSDYDVGYVWTTDKKKVIRITLDTGEAKLIEPPNILAINLCLVKP